MRHVLIILAMGCLCTLTGCATVMSAFISIPNEPLAKQYLAEQGYIEITTDGWGGHRCPRYNGLDHSSTAFTAKTPGGRSVEGVVCCNSQKTCKVREDGN